MATHLESLSYLLTESPIGSIDSVTIALAEEFAAGLDYLGRGPDGAMLKKAAKRMCELSRGLRIALADPDEHELPLVQLLIELFGTTADLLSARGEVTLADHIQSRIAALQKLETAIVA